MSAFEIQSGDLASLDRLAVDALVLPLSAARAQPQGVAGFVDWRLGGRIARWIKSGEFEGRAGELLLTSGHGKIGPKRIFLAGIGPLVAHRPEERTREIGAIVRALIEAGATEAAIAPPESGSTEIIEAWIAAAKPLARLIVLDAGGLDKSQLLERAKSLGWGC